ncbi:MAG: Na+/H+ antiporter NhaA [Marinobacterium sp.]|nr:Na+/H+ antiporter NhaA [Marinobacterium sp.]
MEQKLRVDLNGWLAAFFRMESAAGVILVLVTAVTLLIANSSLAGIHQLLLETPVAVKIGTFEIAKPLLLWINDGLMALFFFLVGLELKRELIDGELSDRRKLILPGIGALGGMAVPALVYTAFNFGDELAMTGWAIPAATDIAFALGILMLLGSRVPVALKVFLTSLAIFDDVGAILIIAVFYSEELSMVSLVVVASCIPVLILLNLLRVESRALYLLIALVMWAAMLKSGVHATLAGVLAAFFIPMKGRKGGQPLKELEHDLHGFVAFGILPVFAFANTGISFTGVGVEQLLHPVSLGIAAGLLVGKIVGVYGCCTLAVRMGWAENPGGCSKLTLFGISALCGIGFTMSLFIGSLAFEETSVNMMFDERLGILLGSALSAIVGLLILNWSLRKPAVS